MYIWEYSLGKLLETLQYTQACARTHTHTHGGIWENKQKLGFKFYKSFQFTQNKLGFSLDGHWSLCWVVSIIQFPRNLINLVYSMNRFSIWSVVKALSSLLFLILWAFRWAVDSSAFLRSALCPGVSTVFLPTHLLCLPFPLVSIHLPCQRTVTFSGTTEAQVSPSDRVDEVWNFMKKISGDLWWQVPFSLGQRWPRSQSRAGTCTPNIGPEPLLLSPPLLWPSPPHAGAS